jgi:hypothetical protein
MRDEQRRAHVTRDLAQVLVIPGRLDAPEHPGGRRGVVPADAKAFAVGRLGAEPGVQAPVDQRADGVYSTCVSRIGEPVEASQRHMRRSVRSMAGARGRPDSRNGREHEAWKGRLPPMEVPAIMCAAPMVYITLTRVMAD